MILVACFFFWGSVTAQMVTDSEGNSLSQTIDSVFDNQGQFVGTYVPPGANISDLRQQLYSEHTQRFQSMPWSAQSILNNQRINVALHVSPSVTKHFVVIIEDNTIVSFSKNQLNNASLEAAMDYGTFTRLSGWNAQSGDPDGGLARAIKDGSITVESKDFIQGIMIGFYKFLI